ncbi:MAG TPA: hypothetical protein DGH68_02235, partial [Bacteroidetes bacterium]|nr:hypothetical protein [Bacteroidota bacterium]
MLKSKHTCRTSRSSGAVSIRRICCSRFAWLKQCSIPHGSSRPERTDKEDSHMKTILGILVLGVVGTLDMQAQGDDHVAPRVKVLVHQFESPTPLLAEVPPVAAPDDNKKDPAYKTYKAGYGAILDEAWDTAMSKFAEVISKYPTSEYIDDAEYWNAYALSHTNWKKAVEAYNKFIHKHPESSYVDDVLADLGNLNQEITISMSGDSNHV